MSDTIKMYLPERVPLGRISVADYNPRVLPPEMRAALREQIRVNGFVQPLIARAEDYLLIGGHQRREVLLEMLQEDGIAPDSFEVPCVLVPGLGDSQAKALNVALNKVTGEWDWSKLAGLLGDLNAEVRGLTGFSDKEVGEMLGLLSGPEPLVSTPEDDSLLDGALAQRSWVLAAKFATEEDFNLVSEALGGARTEKDVTKALLAMARRRKRAKRDCDATAGG